MRVSIATGGSAGTVSEARNGALRHGLRDGSVRRETGEKPHI
jgi:hypothetical protein